LDSITIETIKGVLYEGIFPIAVGSNSGSTIPSILSTNVLFNINKG